MPTRFAPPGGERSADTMCSGQGWRSAAAPLCASAATLASTRPTVQDFSTQPDTESLFRAWARARCARRCLPSGPMVDSVLVRLGLDRWGWYLNQHHLVTDASSTVVLFREVADEYAVQISRGVARDESLRRTTQRSSRWRLPGCQCAHIGLGALA